VFEVRSPKGVTPLGIVCSHVVEQQIVHVTPLRLEWGRLSGLAVSWRIVAVVSQLPESIENAVGRLGAAIRSAGVLSLAREGSQQVPDVTRTPRLGRCCAPTSPWIGGRHMRGAGRRILAEP
jgi:hypothetical protein